MTITSYPFENQDVNESQFSRLFKELQDSGIAGEVGDNTFAVSADGSGLDVQIAPGFAILRGHAVSSDAIESRTLAAAHASLDRIDRVILRLDPVANAITIEVKQGTPAATPVAPTLTYTETGVFELSLAEVRVVAATLNIGNQNVSDNRTYMGQRIGNWTTATRPSDKRRSRLGYNSTTSSWEFWDGTAWVTLAPKKTIRVPHTFTISGEVKVASGDTSYVPPFFVPVPAGQTVHIAAWRTRINSGTSATFSLRKNGGDLTTGQTVTTTTADNGPGAPGYSLANGDRVELVVTSVSGTPKNMSVTLYLDYTV